MSMVRHARHWDQFWKNDPQSKDSESNKIKLGRAKVQFLPRIPCT